MEVATIGLYRKDCSIILSHLKEHEKELKLKRRWLMGLRVSKSKEKRLKFRSLPESLLREDDIFFETVTKHVKEAFGEDDDEMQDDIIEETKKLFDTSKSEGILLSCIDVLTNKGLFHFAMLLARGSVNFGKTRPKLKKAIRELIPRVFRDQHCNIHIEIFSKVVQLLTNPQNVRDNCLTLLIPKFHPYHVSAIKILDRLEELPFDALVAMRRKLKGASAGTPSLHQKRYGDSRSKLIYMIRKISKKMLLELGRGHELQFPLAKALAAAGLLLKLSPATTDFNHFSPEIKMLQNQIVKAIWLLNVRYKVKIADLKRVHLLVDKYAVIGNAFLRTAIKKMLMVYLFECSDMDTIPKSLSQALDIINRNSLSAPSGCCFLKDEVEEDVDCILSVSAHMKQIVSGFLPDHDFDEDFTDAYMEELEESEDDDSSYDYHDKNYSAAYGDNDGQQHHLRIIRRSASCSIKSDLEESYGEYVPADSQPNVDGMLNGDTTQYKVETKQKYTSHLPPTQRSNVAEESPAVDSESPVDIPISNIFSEGEKNASHELSADTNLYLRIQEVCDETSMVAYNLIGQMMKKFAQEEGIHLERSDISYLKGNCPDKKDQVTSCGENVAGSIIVQAVENLMPSLPKSTMEKLKKLIL
ncbi:uncharacterized protein [Euphorbia lathyris]|uniref:uncharacterized protein isoform X2 n=1 Tax=Euphorbia lathyris TaxID=212925 RepID=UPI0033140937